MDDILVGLKVEIMKKKSVSDYNSYLSFVKYYIHLSCLKESSPNDNL